MALCRPRRNRRRGGWGIDSRNLGDLDVALCPQAVLALGGGTLTRPEARELVKSNCKCIYLKAGADALFENLTWKGEAAKRPLLPQGEGLRERIEELLEARSEIYESAADAIVNVDYLSPERIADEIIKTIL